MPRMVRKLSKSESLLNEQMLALLESAADDPKRWHEIGTLSLTKKPGFRNIDSCAEANGAYAERVASNRSARFQSIGGAAPEKTISNAVMRRATPARSSAPATRRTVTSSEPARSIAPKSRRPGFTLASNSWEVRSGIGTLRARRCPRCPLATLFTAPQDRTVYTPNTSWIQRTQLAILYKRDPWPCLRRGRNPRLVGFAAKPRGAIRADRARRMQPGHESLREAGPMSPWIQFWTPISISLLALGVSIWSFVVSSRRQAGQRHGEIARLHADHLDKLNDFLRRFRSVEEGFNTIRLERSLLPDSAEKDEANERMTRMIERLGRTGESLSALRDKVEAVDTLRSNITRRWMSLQATGRRLQKINDQISSYEAQVTKDLATVRLQIEAKALPAP
jgi:hypothetical protein